MTEHIKRDCLEGGFEWRTPVEDVDFTDPTHWGWRLLIINTLRNGMTLVIQLTLTI